MIDYALILTANYKGSSWQLNGETYDGLTWNSDTEKPTKKVLDDQWVSVQAELKAQKQAAIDVRASAIAKLAALGLTADEIAAL